MKFGYSRLASHPRASVKYANWINEVLRRQPNNPDANNPKRPSYLPYTRCHSRLPGAYSIWGLATNASGRLVLGNPPHEPRSSSGRGPASDPPRHHSAARRSPRRAAARPRRSGRPSCHRPWRARPRWRRGPNSSCRQDRVGRELADSTTRQRNGIFRDGPRRQPRPHPTYGRWLTISLADYDSLPIRRRNRRARPVADHDHRR
jgi:hypothetical protein